MAAIFLPPLRLIGAEVAVLCLHEWHTSFGYQRPVSRDRMDGGERSVLAGSLYGESSAAPQALRGGKKIEATPVHGTTLSRYVIIKKPIKSRYRDPVSCKQMYEECFPGPASPAVLNSALP